MSIASLALRALASGGSLDPGEDLWSTERRWLNARFGLVDAVPIGATRGFARDAALRACDMLGRPALLSLQVGDPLAIDQPRTGFARMPGGRYVMAEHRHDRRARLVLGDDWTRFLAGLGHDTRRNMHRYRRKVEAAGLRFGLDWRAPDLAGRMRRHALGAATLPNPRRAARIDADDRFLAARQRPFVARLENDDGAAAVATGFVAGSSAYVVYQLHDREHRLLSLSLAMRSFLTEALIAAGVRELIFPNGCLGLLQQACVAEPLVTVALVRRTPVAMAKATWLVRRVPAHPASEPLRRAWAARV